MSFIHFIPNYDGSKVKRLKKDANLLYKFIKKKKEKKKA